MTYGIISRPRTKLRPMNSRWMTRAAPRPIRNARIVEPTAQYTVFSVTAQNAGSLRIWV